MGNKQEWIIKGKDIRHKVCRYSNPAAHYSAPVWRIQDKFFCLLCNMEPPDHIILQWKLLNEE